MPRRTPLDFSVDPGAIVGPTACNETGLKKASALFDVKFTNDGIVQTRRLAVSYPTL